MCMMSQTIFQRIWQWQMLRMFLMLITILYTVPRGLHGAKYKRKNRGLTSINVAVTNPDSVTIVEMQKNKFT